MILAAEEIGRSLGGAWDLLHRRASGLMRFDVSVIGFWHSFAALVLGLPSLIILFAEDQARDGTSTSLFDDPARLLALSFGFVLCWLIFPALGFLASLVLNRAPYGVAFVVAANWSNVLSTTLLAVPALLFALGLAPESFERLYLAAFLVLVAHLRWFIAKEALGLTGGAALAIVVSDLALEMTITHLVG